MSIHSKQTNTAPAAPATPRAPTQPLYLDTNGAVAFLGGIICRRTLERYRMTDGGPKYAKLGRRAVYKPEWLTDWLESRSFQNTSEARAAGIF